MINLIPKEEKRKMLRDFYFRFAVVCLLALSLCILIGAVVMMPSYFLVSTKENQANKKLETQKSEIVPLPNQETLTMVKNINKELDLIERAENNQFIISQKIINSIISKKMSEIKITEISYESDPQNSSLKDKKINIGGTAPSREVLLLFRRALEGDTAFKQVDLPISNFVKGSNIQFYLSLIPK